MNLHHLELFYYVARHGGITRAVRRMPYGIQQPAVSAQLRRMEEELGAALFDRRPFALTAAGEELYAFIRPFFEELPEVVRRLRGEAMPRLRLAASATVLAHYVPLVLSRMRERFPGLRLSLAQVTPSRAEELLLGNECDLAVSAVIAPPDDRISVQPLLEVPLALLTREGDPVEGWEALVGGREILDEPLVCLHEEEPVTCLFQRGLAARGLRWDPVIVVNQLELVEDYVRAGFGYGVCAQLPGRPPGSGLRQVPLPGFPPLPIAALHRGTLGPVLEHFLEQARAMVALLERRRPEGEAKARRRGRAG